mgnify:CR=1 FL=1
MPEAIIKPNVLLVEGEDDKRFFETLCKHIQKDVQVIRMYGKDNLKGSLEAIVKGSDFRQVVKAMEIIMDAYNDPSGRFCSIRNTLVRLGLPCPSKPFDITGEKPRIGVAVLPDENTPGELEDLCLESVKEEPAFSCVELYFKCLQEKAIQPRKLSKAKVYVYLASKERPGLRLGEAAEAQYFQFSHSSFKKISDFINSLAE